MEKILEKARELGKLIADSEIYINSKEKEALFLQDEEASTLMYEYTKTQENLSKEFQKPNITKEEIEDIKFKSTKAFEKLLMFLFWDTFLIFVIASLTSFKPAASNF